MYVFVDKLLQPLKDVLINFGVVENLVGNYYHVGNINVANLATRMNVLHVTKKVFSYVYVKGIKNYVIVLNQSGNVKENVAKSYNVDFIDVKLFATMGMNALHVR